MTSPQSIRWIITLALVVVVILLSVVPGHPQAGDSEFAWLVAATPTLIQKIMHFVIYAVLAILWIWTLEKRVARDWPRVFFAFLITVSLGAVLEWFQTQIPGRFGSLFDVLLNTCGVLAGVLAAILVCRHKGQNFCSFGLH